MSSEADGIAFGNEPDLPGLAFWPADTSPADFDLVGSPDISARKLLQARTAEAAVQMATTAGIVAIRP